MDRGMMQARKGGDDLLTAETTRGVNGHTGVNYKTKGPRGVRSKQGKISNRTIHTKAKGTRQLWEQD